METEHDEAAAEIELPADFNGAEAHPAAQEPSVVDLLKKDLQELQERKDTFIHIVGYESSGLQVRYRLPESGKELDQVARKAMRDFKDQYSRNLYIAIDSMIRLNIGLYAQPPDIDEVTEPVELDPQNTGSPCGFDAYLAEIMGWPAGEMTARQIVRKLFGNNEPAILFHSEKLNRWLMNTKADLNLEVWQMGE